MHVHSLILGSLLLLLLTINVDGNSSPSTLQTSTITKTQTVGKVTQTVTTKLPPHGAPAPLSNLVAPGSFSPHIHDTNEDYFDDKPSGSRKRAIAFIVAGGVVLCILGCWAKSSTRKQDRKRHERIRDWIEMSAGHGRYSGLSNDWAGCQAGGHAVGGVVTIGVGAGAMESGTSHVEASPPPYTLKEPERAVLRSS